MKTSEYKSYKVNVVGVNTKRSFVIVAKSVAEANESVTQHMNSWERIVNTHTFRGGRFKRFDIDLRAQKYNMFL